MAKYVLISDLTLVNDYRNFPLLDFLPCAPASAVPDAIYGFLRGPHSPAMPNGESLYTAYAVRKVEAALLQRFNRNDIVVPHEDHIESFITDDTEIIGVSTMDPLGIGPLTMSYGFLFSGSKANKYYPWVRKEWDRLIARLNRARKGKKAKLVVGGPGVWEFTILPEELDKQNIDYVVQGETEDVICDLFEGISNNSIDTNKFYKGFLSYDDNFHTSYKEHPKFICRHPSSKRIFPMLEEIPAIVRPAMKGIVEAMRGCGIGCDFCEVTLRPLRYNSLEFIQKEIEVNVNGGNGHDYTWLHSDEIFAYKHLRYYQPNEEALLDLFKMIMSTKGIKRTNPTHGRISIPAAYPEMIEKFSQVLRASPRNWIGVQVGVETGSDKLARLHMPNKTLPLKIGVDGTWQEIVWNGTHNFNRYYWRPAFTVQVGQNGETDEDNWDTVALINKMSNSLVDGRPFEFSATPMKNVPLGKIKSNDFTFDKLNESQLAVYYASYRHLYKVAARNARKDLYSPGGLGITQKLGTGSLISFGGWGMMKYVERMAKKGGVDIEKVKRHGIDDGSIPLRERKFGISIVQQVTK